MPNFDYKDFMTEFITAEHIGGMNAVQCVYDREFAKWKGNVEYFASFVMTLKHRLWDHYERGNKPYVRLYDRLAKTADAYAHEHFEGKDVEYYITLLTNP